MTTTTSTTRIVSTFHPASAVVASCKACLSGSDIEHLVVLHPSSIDVFSIQDHGLELECSTRLWGSALSVKSIVIGNTEKHNLLVLLDHPEPELLCLSFMESKNEDEPAALHVLDTISLVEPGQRHSEFYSDFLVDPAAAFAIVSVYPGKLKLVTFEDGSSKDKAHIDIPIPELNVLSLDLIRISPEEGDDTYALAILHMTHTKAIQLAARDLSVSDGSLTTEFYSTIVTPTLVMPKNFPLVYEDVPTIIFTPDYLKNDAQGGIIVVGGRKILLYALNSPSRQRQLKRKREKAEASKKATTRSKRNNRQDDDESDVLSNTHMGKPAASVQWPFDTVTAASSIDGRPLAWLVGDTFGRLTLLSLEEQEAALTLVVLGETSVPNSLTYITNQMIYVGSSGGDSQVVQIGPELENSNVVKVDDDITGKVFSEKYGIGERAELPEKGQVVVSKQGSYLNVKRTFQNLSPLSDAVLVNLDDARHNQLVTCSGRDNTGSLNIVRMGTDLRTLATIGDCSDVVRAWPLRRIFSDTIHRHVVLSTLDRTFALRIGGKSTWAADDSRNGFVTDAPTICVGNVMEKLDVGGYNEMSNLVVQVTSKEVILLDYDMGTDSYERLTDWAPSGPASTEITAASVNPSQVLVSYPGHLELLRIVNRNLVRNVNLPASFAKKGVHGPSREDYDSQWPDRISCVTCVPLDPTANFTLHIAAAFWHTNQVKVYSLRPGVIDHCCETPCLKAPVKSLLFYNFGTEKKSRGPEASEEFKAFLLVGMVDGTIASFKWTRTPATVQRNGSWSLTEPKYFSVGSGPVSLSPATIGNGTKAVTAVADKAVIVACPTKRLYVSALALQDVAYSCPLNTEGFPDSLLLMTSKSLLIGAVDDLTTIHIQQFPQGDAIPLRIVRAPSGFGVVFKVNRPGRIGIARIAFYDFRLLDDNLKVLHQWVADQLEVVTSVTTVQSNDATSPFFVVGSYKEDLQEVQPTSGRILLFDSELSTLAEIPIDGCPFALTTVNGLVAAAVNASVCLFRIITETDGGVTLYSLHKISEWSHFYNVIGLTTSENGRLVAADALQSVSILEVTRYSKLDAVSKDYSPMWPVAVDAYGSRDVVGANDALNLFSYSVETVDVRPTLKRTGFYFLGEMVTKIISGSITPDVSAPLKPAHMFFTNSGAIGIITVVEDEEIGQKLIALQQRMGMHFTGIGGTSHARYRAPHISQRHSQADSAYGFVDGDFVERLLPAFEESAEEINKVFEGETVEATEEMQKLIENLQGVHL